MSHLMKKEDHLLARLLCCACFLFLLALLPQRLQARHAKDTVHFKLSVAEKKSLVLSDSVLNEIGLDSLLNKVQNVHLTLDQINNATSLGFDLRDLIKNYAEIDSNIDNISDNLTMYNQILDVKNLQMFEVLLADLQGQVAEWRAMLIDYNKQLTAMGGEMTAFRKDTVLKSLLADSAFKSIYPVEITDLKTKWRAAKKSINENQSIIKQWLAITTNEYFETIDLQNKLKSLLRKISLQSLGKEYDYLWNIHSKTIGQSAEASQLAQRSYHGQRRILIDYFRRHWEYQFWMLICGLLFGLWVWFNFRKVNGLRKTDTPGLQSLIFINKLPVLPAIVVLLNLAPFFDIHPPTAYVEITGLLLVIAVTFLNFKTWPRNLFYFWLIIVACYIAFSLTGTFFTPTLGFRILLLSLNIAAVLFSVVWIRKLYRHTLLFSTMIKVVSVIFLLLNITSIGCNLFGRLSLAKIFSVTAVYGLTQIIGLTVFIQIMLEAFHLQTIVNQLKGGLIAKLNFHRIQKLLNRLLMATSICLWTIVFTISLNVYNAAFTWITAFLVKQRKIGTTTFEIGSILMFILIIYISNLLQQGVGSLLGKSEGAWDPDVKKNGSRLAMTRLVLIVLGFLIAVAASGLPVDKITIVLGALGVGIGLGLQGIVNNLVSGVILIFEQPFRIGDYIQIGDKRGRVLDIGIRSSRMVMEEGAELIMPNGDLLSGMVVNWTTRNDNVRISLPLNVETSHTYDEVRKIIFDDLKNNNHVVLTPAPEILLKSHTDKILSLDILIWISNVHQMQTIKSEVLKSIYDCLLKNEIKITI